MYNRFSSSFALIITLLLITADFNSGQLHDSKRILIEDTNMGLLWEQYAEPVSRYDFPADTAYTLIDIREVDTTAFEELYELWLELPVSAGFGTPVIIGDTDKDSLIEIIGLYVTTRTEFHDSLDRTRMYEFDGDNDFNLIYLYPDSTRSPISVRDLDNDGFEEVLIRNRGQAMRVFESDSAQPAINEVSRYNLWEVSSSLSYEKFHDMDGDGQMDMVHVGDSDTLPHASMIVAEYDTAEQRLIRRFIMDPTVDYNSSLGMGIGDFDEDGRMEMVSSSGRGDVYVVENIGNDTYRPTWQGNAGIFNAYANLGTNDIDGNGKPEFFAGGSAPHDSLGSLVRFTQFEYVSDDSFNPVAVLDIYPVGWIFREMITAVDADGDGDEELLMVIAGHVLLFEAFAPGRYRIVWMKRYRGVDLKGALIADVTGDGYKELLVNFDAVHPQQGTDARFFTDIYRLRGVVSAQAEPETFLPKSPVLEQNYPNPFNPITEIRFDLPVAEHTTLIIYDLLGREVIRLVDEFLEQGRYEYRWDATGKPSGMYIYKLTSGNFVQTKKMVLLK